MDEGDITRSWPVRDIVAAPAITMEHSRTVGAAAVAEEPQRAGPHKKPEIVHGPPPVPTRLKAESCLPPGAIVSR